MPEFNEELLVYPHSPPVTVAWFSALWDGSFLRLEEVMFETCQLSWIPSPSKMVSNGILASRSLNRSKLTLLNSKAGILLLWLIPPLRILNSTVSWPLQPTANILNQFFLFCKDQVHQSMSLHQQHCHPCRIFVTPVHSRNIPDCLWSALLAFEKILDILWWISYKIEQMESWFWVCNVGCLDKTVYLGNTECIAFLQPQFHTVPVIFYITVVMF